MRTLTICYLLLGLPILLAAQTEQRIAGYFDSNWVEVTEKERATYYRTIEVQAGGLFLVKDYYMSGQLQMQPVLCKSYRPKLEWEGNTILYHENGKVKEEGFFKNEERNGLHTFWYNNGAQHQVVWYDKNVIVKIHQYWSIDGKELLKNGTGIIEEFSDGKTFFTEIHDSVHVSTYSFDESVNSLVYLQAEKIPEYKGGVKNMHRVIAKNTKYPKASRKAGIEGTVYISFIVDEQGKSINHKVLKGLSKDCDDEALRATKFLTDWIPGSHKGNPVKVQFVYPIKFKIY